MNVMYVTYVTYVPTLCVETDGNSHTSGNINAKKILVRKHIHMEGTCLKTHEQQIGNTQLDECSTYLDECHTQDPPIWKHVKQSPESPQA